MHEIDTSIEAEYQRGPGVVLDDNKGLFDDPLSKILKTTATMRRQWLDHIKSSQKMKQHLDDAAHSKTITQQLRFRAFFERN